MKYLLNNKSLFLELDGDFDNLKVKKIKERIKEDIDKNRPANVYIDFKNVSFVDSTGIGFVLARYKQVKEYGGDICIYNLSKDNKKIFDMSGIFTIINYKDGEICYE